MAEVVGDDDDKHNNRNNNAFSRISSPSGPFGTSVPSAVQGLPNHLLSVLRLVYLCVVDAAAMYCMDAGCTSSERRSRLLVSNCFWICWHVRPVLQVVVQLRPRQIFHHPPSSSSFLTAKKPVEWSRQQQQQRYFNFEDLEHQVKVRNEVLIVCQAGQGRGALFCMVNVEKQRRIPEDGAEVQECLDKGIPKTVTGYEVFRRQAYKKLRKAKGV